MRIFPVLLGVALVVSAATGCRKSSGDTTISFEADDAEMNAAIVEAKRRWPEFVQAYDVRRPDQHFMVKYPFKLKGKNGAEHIWVSVTALRDDQVTGTIDNEPDNDIGHKLGDTVTVPARDLSDWMYATKGASEKDWTGGFTIKVMLARQKK